MNGSYHYTLVLLGNPQLKLYQLSGVLSAKTDVVIVKYVFRVTNTEISSIPHRKHKPYMCVSGTIRCPMCINCPFWICYAGGHQTGVIKTKIITINNVPGKVTEIVKILQRPLGVKIREKLVSAHVISINHVLVAIYPLAVSRDKEYTVKYQNEQGRNNLYCLF